jgi:hypothetical protein
LRKEIPNILKFQIPTRKRIFQQRNSNKGKGNSKFQSQKEYSKKRNSKFQHAGRKFQIF